MFGVCGSWILRLILFRGDMNYQLSAVWYGRKKLNTIYERSLLILILCLCQVVEYFKLSCFDKISSHFSCALDPHTPPRLIFSVNDKCCSNIVSWWRYVISSDRLLTFIIGTCDAIQKISQIRPISTPQYRPTPRTKGSNILSRSRTTADIYQISRIVTWRRISHRVWLSFGVLPKLWGLRRPILIRCCCGLRRKWAKSIWWTQRYKAKMSRSPERHRDTDSQPLNPSCRVWRTCNCVSRYTKFISHIFL